MPAFESMQPREAQGVSIESARKMLDMVLRDTPILHDKTPSTGEINAFIIGLRVGERAYREKHSGELFARLILSDEYAVKINLPF